MKVIKEIEAEVIDFQEARAKAGGSSGGFDHFSGMTTGTTFCCIQNGNSGSLLEEYMLCSKAGATVLLQTTEGRFERHIGDRFWKHHTLVQILHIPEEGITNGAGNSL